MHNDNRKSRIHTIKMQFGVNEGPDKFCIASEITIDLAQEIAENKPWNPSKRGYLDRGRTRCGQPRCSCTPNTSGSLDRQRHGARLGFDGRHRTEGCRLRRRGGSDGCRTPTSTGISRLAKIPSALDLCTSDRTIHPLIWGGESGTNGLLYQRKNLYIGFRPLRSTRLKLIGCRPIRVTEFDSMTVVQG
jgi:hypothetical protein